MPSGRNYPVASAILADDSQSIQALKELANYTPHRPEHEVEALVSLEQLVAQTKDELSRSQRAVDAVRVRLTELSWALHRNVVGARDEVAVIFGPNSYEVHAVGRKRVSERKRRVRRVPPSQ